MHIKNPDVFRTWLIRQLEPICKANPEPVSKYVCALFKKHKGDAELKNNLVSQLYIFLHSATEEFVNFLIQVIENEKYLTNDANFHCIESTDSNKENEEKVEEVETIIPADSVLPTLVDRKSPSIKEAPTPSPPKRILTQKASSPKSRRVHLRNDRRRLGLRKIRRDSSHSDSPNSERRVVRKRSASGSSGSSNKSPRRSWIAARTSDFRKHKYRNFVRSPISQRSRKPMNENLRKRLRPPSHDNERNHLPNKQVAPFQNDNTSQDLPHQRFEKQRCIDFESKGYCARGDMCPYDHGPSPIVLDNNMLTGMVPLPPPLHPPFVGPGLYPPQFVNPHAFLPGKPVLPNRELIAVPTQREKQLKSGKPSYGHVFSSLPPGVSQTSIELTNVLVEKNNIPHLYDTFSTFGNLTLVQCKRNGDASTALLTFTNATEAALAFTNVSSAMPNVKAAWYADKCILKPFPRKSIPASTSTKKSYVINRALAAKKAPLPNKPKPYEPCKEKNEAQIHEDCRLLKDLIKMKHELLEKQWASRKEIEEKLKTLEVGSQEQKTCREMLSKLNERIAENQKSIKESLQQREEYLKKLKIVKIAKAVNDTDKRSDEAEQKLEGKISPLRGSSQNENNGGAVAGIEYTRVVVSGFENGDEDELIEHFSKFGKIVDKEMDNTIPSATLIYDNRKSAERAKAEGKIFQERLMTVTVYGSKKLMPSLRRTPAFKAQEYVPQSNRYKYKKPEMAHSIVTPVPALNRTVGLRRTEQTNPGIKIENEQLVDNRRVKLTEEEDLVTFLQKAGIDPKEVEKYKD